MKKTLGIIFAASALAASVSASTAQAAAGETVLRLKAIQVEPDVSGDIPGLDFDGATGRLFCACDAGVLVTLEVRSGKVLDEKPLAGVPDVVFFNRQRQQLYVAIGDPGVVDVFATSPMAKLATIGTEPGAHTTALSPRGDRLYAFLPRTHRAAIFDIKAPV